MNAAWDSFHFLRPAWLALLLLLPVAALWWRRRPPGSIWNGLVDRHLLPALLVDQGGGQGGGRQLLLGLLWALCCLALAGPAWRQTPQPLLARQAALVLLLDLSDGMRASDLPPSRLARARFKLADLLRQRVDGQTGLIAYAGDAFTVAPLTDDRRTLESLLAALEPEVMPVPGQRLDRALREARRLLEDAGFKHGEVLVLSHRADAAATAAAGELHAAGFQVHALGVGLATGAPLPLGGGGFARDASGAILLSRLEADSLSELANAGGGRYVELSSGNDDLARLGVLDHDRGGERQPLEDQSLRRFEDDGPWLLLLALPLAALLFRRGLLFALPWLLLATAPPPAQAFGWDDLWQRPEQRAWQALQAGDAERAQQLAADPALRGSAAYRAGDYAAAIEQFGQDSSARGHYNRGNALAQAGRLQEALAAYQEALQRDPEHADAAHNRDLLQQLLDQQSPQPESSAGEQGEPEPGGQADPDAEGEQGEQNAEAGDSQTDAASASGGDPQAQQAGEQTDSANAEGEQGDPGSSADAEAAEAAQREAMEQALQAAAANAGEPQDGAVPALDSASQERQQASEQWLRRVPDDPGGLLRRKFALEYRRRQLEGETE